MEGFGMGQEETKIVYDEDGQVRAVRGQLREDTDPDFLILDRFDGSLIKISKRIILKIEQPGRGGY
jgi:hypothetical protein